MTDFRPPALISLVEALRSRVNEAVDRRRRVDPEPGDGFLGLHLSDARLDELSRREPNDLAVSTRWFTAPPAGDPLAQLRASAGLDDLDLSLLAIAAAPEIDRRFEWSYGYLADDLTKKRATLGLAIELCDHVPTDPLARRKASRSGSLARHGLLEFDDPARPLLGQSLRVPERVVSHLLGDHQLASWLVPLHVDTATLPLDELPTAPLPAASERSLIYLRSEGGAGLFEAAASVVARSGTERRPLVLDLRQRPAGQPLDDLATAVQLEALLRSDITIIVGPLTEAAEAAALRPFFDAQQEVIVTGTDAWNPAWSRRPPLEHRLDIDRPGGWAIGWGLPDETSELQDLAAFRLDGERTLRAARAAELAASIDGTPVGTTHRRLGARLQNAATLENLARRTEPTVDWSDLVLPASHLEQLHEIVARARLRPVVLDGWGMRRGGGRGEGIAVLFAGESGTGKTMSAEVIAGALGQDLYRIDLSTVVDKYIGETEKNLERIFTEAEHANGVLFFDEADALFGKRSEVSDAHDRHANVEVAYLLQRMEEFSGLAILATNLRANLDDAFTRRLTALIDFPMPDATDRARLWDRCLGATAPRDAELDLEFCAKQFELSGGAIRNITLTAAFRAADEEQPISMEHLIRATRQEYVKMGRLVTESEFRNWA